MWRVVSAGRRLLPPLCAAAGGARRPEPPSRLAGAPRGGCAAVWGAGGGRAGSLGAAAAEQRQAAETVLPKFNINFVVALLRQENAKDICVIQIPPEIKYCNYFIIVSGSSTRHLHAMAHYMLKMELANVKVPTTAYPFPAGFTLEEETNTWLHYNLFTITQPLKYKYYKEESDPHTQIEGKETDDWLCIDFGSIVTHFMLPETREAYELEKLWTLGSYDDQLAQMIPQSLPEDFIFGLTPNSSDRLETRT